MNIDGKLPLEQSSIVYLEKGNQFFVTAQGEALQHEDSLY